MDVIRLGILAAVGGALYGCGTSDAEQAERAVRAALHGSESIEFRSVESVRSTKYEGMVFVCGEVNVKGAMGGSSGYKRFVYTDSVPILNIEPDEPGPLLAAFEELWLNECKP